MLLIAAIGTTFTIGEPMVKMSIAPERTWLNMSVLLPSWLLGKISISRRPLVCVLIASTASLARVLIGCATGRSLPYFMLNSAARARPPMTLAPMTAPAAFRTVLRLMACLMAVLPVARDLHFSHSCLPGDQTSTDRLPKPASRRSNVYGSIAATSFSAIMMVGMLVLARGTFGITDASATPRRAARGQRGPQPHRDRPPPPYGRCSSH